MARLPDLIARGLPATANCQRVMLPPLHTQLRIVGHALSPKLVLAFLCVLSSSASSSSSSQCSVQVGGVPAVLKYLLQKGFLHGDCLTVTGTALCSGFLGGPGGLQSLHLLLAIV